MKNSFTLRRVDQSNERWNTFIAFSLLPISGLAMDIYIPSLPDMALQLNVSPSAIQLTLPIFIISYGITQFMIGGLIDRYGRYLPCLFSLFLFSMASLGIAYSDHIYFIYAMRIIQGIASGVIAVSKRAYFVDLFSGTRLKKYTSMFSVVWALAPIVAPFLGGFFQTRWGWESNFIFLGGYGFLIFVIELISGGETMKEAQAFRLSDTFHSYKKMIGTPDFTASLLIIGLLYAILIVYGMASPFLIERQLGYSATFTGYCALLSGVCVFSGGLLSRIFIQKPLYKKVLRVNGMAIAFLVVLIPLSWYYANIFTLLLYVICLHVCSGFIFNNFMSYGLTRFPKYAGKSAGLLGGGFSIITAIVSSVFVNTLKIESQPMLGTAYAVLLIGTLFLILGVKWKQN
ncbi:MFS transporter [Sphingobacterium faecale]|uniref:MFS transporter n=1 Tax=Sphingobacterium faecale TaxID=2803775 RepID=A0ABS1R5I7_9SPHI|nr:MFS transporter [Sphingobacterium faecale]MBL1409923.1 MFS transporter [Sphingobacterium faecale]